MPYYTGDYYQGDYYQGDIFGSIFRVAKGAVGGFLKGGPIGAVKGGLGAVIGKQAPATTPNVPMIVGPPPPVSVGIRSFTGTLPDVPKTTPGAVPQPGVRGTIERMLPGGQTGYISGAALGQGAPSGFHWNKSFSYAKGLPAGSFLVRNRQMNPLNPRALRRTVRRQRGAVGLMRAVLAGSGYTIKRSGLPSGRGKKRRR